MKNELESIKEEIKQIQIRNRRVENDKRWETSNTRKVGVIFITYIFMVFVMYSIGADKPIIGAIIPTLGYFLSTLSLGFLKKIWERNQ